MYIKFKNGKSKVLTLSYDDGVVQDIRLIEILNKNGIKATFNLNSGLFVDESKTAKRKGNHLKLSEAKDLYLPSGHEIAAHGFKHKSLTQISPQEAVYDVIHDREILEKEFGVNVRGMAYANGVFNNSVAQILDNCGIAYSRTTKSTHSFGFPENWLTLHPTCHHNDEKLIKLSEKFVNSSPMFHNVWMLYVWGHSYEFDNDNNWEQIEKFAELTGGKDDVWYATNIEIYDYVTAFKRLIATVDEKIIFNPNSIDVWVEIEEEIICIKAGQTIYR